MKTFVRIKNITNTFAGISVLYLAFSIAIDMGGWAILLSFITIPVFLFFAALAAFHFMRGAPSLKSYHLFALIMSLIFDSVLFMPVFFATFKGRVGQFFDFVKNYSNVSLSAGVLIGSGYLLFTFFVALSLLLEAIYGLLSLKSNKKEENNIFNSLIKIISIVGSIICVGTALVHIRNTGTPYVLILFGALITTLLLMSFSKEKDFRSQLAIALLFISIAFYTVFYINFSLMKYANEPIEKLWLASWIAVGVILPTILVLNVIYFVKLKPKKNEIAPIAN